MRSGHADAPQPILIRMNRYRRPRRLALLACIGLSASACQIPPTDPTPGATPAAAAADRRARAQQAVIRAAADPEPQLRMRAVEAARHLGDGAAPLVTAAVDDAHPAVRYAAWVTAGRLKMAGLAAPARAAAQHEDEPDYVRAAAAFAAAQIGAAPTPGPGVAAGPPEPVPRAAVDLGPIASLLWSDRAGMRANAAVLLGESGVSTAKPMLRDAANRPTPRASAVAQALLDLQIREALVELGDEDQLKPIRLAAYSKDDQVRVLAVEMLGRLGDRTMEGAVMSFLDKDPQELRLAAARALGDLGWPDGLAAALDGAASDLARIRGQAALAVGRAALAVPPTNTPRDTRARDAAHAALDRLLNDPEPSVRLSAAAAVLEPAR